MAFGLSAWIAGLHPDHIGATFDDPETIAASYSAGFIESVISMSAIAHRLSVPGGTDFTVTSVFLDADWSLYVEKSFGLEAVIV